jgi:hypothetical protein
VAKIATLRSMTDHDLTAGTWDGKDKAGRVSSDMHDVETWKFFYAASLRF